MKTKKSLLKIFLLIAALTFNFHHSLAETTFKIVDGVVDPALKARMEANVNAMIKTFGDAAEKQEKSIKLSKDNFTSKSLKEVKQIWESSAMRCPKSYIVSSCLKTSTGYQVRGIPVDIVEADSKDARQELTIDFDSSGKISNVAIAIDLLRYKEIMDEKEDTVDFSHRQVIVDFIEDFRTAYNRRDMKYLNSVYSDNALIITGRVMKEKPKSNVTKMTLTNNKVVYIKQTKQEYLTRLARIFKKVKYLNVKFEEIEVIRDPKYENIYGVTLKQYWNTSGYSDEGYLFLMIDFKDDKNPLIHVRTWQPYKDQNGNILTEKKDVFHLGSFKNIVYKNN